MFFRVEVSLMMSTMELELVATAGRFPDPKKIRILLPCFVGTMRDQGWCTLGCGSERSGIRSRHDSGLEMPIGVPVGADDGPLTN